MARVVPLKQPSPVLNKEIAERECLVSRVLRFPVHSTHCCTPPPPSGVHVHTTVILQHRDGTGRGVRPLSGGIPFLARPSFWSQGSSTPSPSCRSRTSVRRKFHHIGRAVIMQTSRREPRVLILPELLKNCRDIAIGPRSMVAL